MTTRWDELWPKIDDIPGWLSKAEGETLYNVARTASEFHPITIIEIGSYCGRSTACFAFGLLDSLFDGTPGRIVSIDHHIGSPEIVNGPKDTFPYLQETLRRLDLSRFVIPVVTTSRQASWLTIPCDVLFIDGDHRFEFVNEDAQIWLSHLRSSGIALFHDYVSATGPRMVVDRLIDSGLWSVHHKIDDLIQLERTPMHS